MGFSQKGIFVNAKKVDDTKVPFMFTLAIGGVNILGQNV